LKLYVGNLAFNTSEDSLRSEFGKHGEVDEVTIITDRETGRSRGFGFVSMPNSAEASAAMEAINGTEVDGRSLTVNEARPKREGGGGGGGGGGYGGRRD